MNLFIKLSVLCITLFVSTSEQKPTSLSSSLGNEQNNKLIIQGRYRRADDIIPGAPLSEEEFRLSLFQTIEATNEIDPTNQGLQTNGLVEGDIIAGYDEDSGGNKSHNAVSSDELLWKDGIVPYTISDAFSREDRQIIARGMRNIQDKSCIQFVPRTTEEDYVRIINGNGCFSAIGRSKGPQDLSLQRNRCVSVETVIHEMMHALGFEHEHNRPDRDDYILLNKDNMIDGAIKQHFEKYDPLRYRNFTSYDINSIMHYKAFAWAKDEKIPTIRSKQKKKTVGSVDGLLSPVDQMKLNRLYKCDLSLAVNVECPVAFLGVADNACSKIPKLGCYCIVRDRKTRAQADQFCRDHQMQLVWLETQKESQEVSKFALDNGMSGFWTSGIDVELGRKWRWEQQSTSTSFPTKYFNWCPGDPDNYDGDEHYILAKSHFGKICWEDATGDLQSPAICKPPLSAKLLLDNLIKLHSQLTVAFKEIQELQKRNNEVMAEFLEFKENFLKLTSMTSAPTS